MTNQFRFINCAIPRQGFSLAEILIALTLLGILSAFAVPKLLNSVNNSQSGKFSAITKDMATAILSAYNQYKETNASVATTTKGVDILANTNYIKIETSGTIDDVYGYGTGTCSAASQCYRYPNGGVLLMDTTESFNGKSTTNAVAFWFDPDGKVTNGGGASTDGKAIRLLLYYDGKIRTWGTVLPGTTSSTVGWGGYSVSDPPWFSGL